jgi:uncharacterized protein (TIGR03083 family)
MAEWDRDAAVSGYVDALESIRSLAQTVDLARWHEATDLPGWDVQDGFAHVASLESGLLGRSDPEHELDYEALPHVGDDFIKRHMERGVDLRRQRSASAVRDELVEVVDLRIPEVMALPADPDFLVRGVMGKPRPIGGMLTVRAWDVWAHEQDIRRAVNLPERLTGAAADTAQQRIVAALPDVVAELGLHEGTTIRWVVTGPLECTETVTATHDGALADDVDANPDAQLTMDWPTFAHLAAGRVDPSHARVSVEGDVGLAEKVLAAMAITP